jgi:phenylpyruvate tautomerase PptA (4-oxalocrotonate tautomerase family)
MPIYTCTVAESTLAADTKRALAVEIARIHSSIAHVPSTYVNVAFHELAADGLYTDGVPANPVLVTVGCVRATPRTTPQGLPPKSPPLSPRYVRSTWRGFSSSSSPAQRVSPWRAAAFSLSPVRRKAGSPEVDGGRLRATPDRTPTALERSNLCKTISATSRWAST